MSDPSNEQDLRFRDIYFLNRIESDSPDRWFSARNIDYKVTVSGRRFWNLRGEGYEQGLLTGVFLGPQHEHMGGTVKRTDMVAAFGGSREEEPPAVTPTVPVGVNPPRRTTREALNRLVADFLGAQPP